MWVNHLITSLYHDGINTCIDKLLWVVKRRCVQRAGEQPVTCPVIKAYEKAM